MLPRISLNQMAIEVGESLQIAKQKGVLNIPVIPPRGTTVNENNQYVNSDDTPTWFVVMSPRETKGITGPFSIPQLRQMYKYGEIHDKSLLWKEGEEDWRQLIHQMTLRTKLIQLPLLPPIMGSYNAELAVFDPIMNLPSIEKIDTAVNLKEFEVSRSCFRCGGIAVAHLTIDGDTNLDLFRCREEVGTTQFASEILPGFLWVGNSGSSKKKSILKLGITLMINCAANMNNPFSNPPYYRCRDAPLKEKPQRNFDEAESAALLVLFEKVYDWIEIERTTPHHAALADPSPPQYRGNTDKYGFPMKQEKPFRKLKPQEKEFPSRVLLWSRLGFDRSCVVAAAYLIKHFGISAERSVSIIRNNRPTCDISSSYAAVLQLWAAKHTKGALICLDCKFDGLRTDSLPLEPSSATSSSAKNPGDVTATTDVEHYDSFAQLMLTHLPRLVRSDEEVSRLAHADQYLVKLRTGFCVQSPWSGLMDLQLVGKNLSDLTLAILLQLLSGNDLMRNLRIINLQNNQAGPLAMKALLVAFFPVEDAEDGADYQFDDTPQRGDESESQGSEEERVGAHQLVSLDLAQNKLDEYAVKYLCYFLKQTQSLTSLNVTNNDLPDLLCSDIIACLEKPLPDFVGGGSHARYGAAVAYGDDDSIHSNDQLPLHNCSITALYLGYNHVGQHAAEALSKTLKHNVVLSILHLELSSAMSPASFKEVTNSIRVYNSVLREVVLADTTLTVKSAERIARILDSMDNQIVRLNLSNCGLKHQHMEVCAKYLTSGKHLTDLDLSDNPLCDRGAEHLAIVLRGKRDFSGIHCPPLKRLNIRCCGLTVEGCGCLALQLIHCCSLQHLDISHNQCSEVSPVAGRLNTSSCDSELAVDFLNALGDATISELVMTSCHLQSKNASALFTILADAARPLARHLRCLFVAENNVADSASGALCDLLARNRVLELLDLGFNQFTGASSEVFRHAVKVSSDSDTSKKVCDLAINMIGNHCDPYVLETPGMSRSKSTLLFGTKSNPHDSLNRGFSHVPLRSRGNFLVRRELDERYHKQFTSPSINVVS